MKVLTGMDESLALKFLEKAAEVAKNSTCLRAKCGSVIISGYNIIGEGFNSPPGNHEEQRRCLEHKSELHPKVSDKTCCIHAEQRAIISALMGRHDKIFKSDIYFARIDERGKIQECGAPYCTHCSKLTLDVGISRFILLNKEGICAYNTQEYNLLSFKYGGEDD